MQRDSLKYPRVSFFACKRLAREICAQKKAAYASGSYYGDKGIRTPDLLNAIQTRSQLRHTPKGMIVFYSMRTRIASPFFRFSRLAQNISLVLHIYTDYSLFSLALFVYNGLNYEH